MELALQVCLADQQGLLGREADLPSCVRYAANCPGRARTLSVMRTQELGLRRSANIRSLRRLAIQFKKLFRQVLAVAVGLLLAAPAFAQMSSPWENAVNVLMQAFTSTIARGLSLVAIVVSGLTFAFGEGGSKRVLAGVLFGVGMAIAAVNFMAWLFP
jgi:type IV secretion system protein TrbC